MPRRATCRRASRVVGLGFLMSFANEVRQGAHKSTLVFGNVVSPPQRERGKYRSIWFVSTLRKTMARRSSRSLLRAVVRNQPDIVRLSWDAERPIVCCSGPNDEVEFVWSAMQDENLATSG